MYQKTCLILLHIILKYPKKYQHLSIKILFIIKSKNDKTLLIQTIIREIKYPFFSINKSNFIKLFININVTWVCNCFV